MAQDDMHVVMCKILSYLYWCLRNGVEPEQRHYAHDGDVLSIPYAYWAAIIRELVANGHVRGFAIVETWGGDSIVNATSPAITMAGVEFLSENSMMRKALKFLQDAKSAPPFV